MNKLGLVAAVVVVGAVAAVPFVSGMLIEQRISAYQLPAGAPAGLQWHLDSYQRGYLHSTARSTLSFSSPSLDQPVRIQLKQEIDQVPGLDGRLATVRTTWLPSPQVKAELAKVLGDKEPIVLNTAMMWNGASRTTGTLAAFSLPTAQFSGGTLALDTEKDGHFDFSMNMASLAATDPEDGTASAAPVVLKGLTLVSQGVLSPEGIAWNSQFQLGVDALSSGETQIGGLSLIGQSAAVGAVLNTAMGLKIKSFQAEDLPPAAKGMRDFELHYQLDGLDIKSLTALTQQLREAQKSNPDPDQLKQIAMMALMTHVPDLLNHGVALQINPVGFDSDAGKVALNLSINLPAGHGQQVLSNPMALLGVLNIKGDYRAPQALMNAALSESGEAAAENQLNALIQAGYVNANQGVVSTNFVYEQGKLRINGKPADDLLGAVGALGR